MSGFKKVKDPTDADVIEAPISSLTLSVGDLLELDAGATTWTEADSNTLHWQRKCVCQTAATSSDTSVRCIPVNPQDLWEASSANNSSASHNGDRMVLTDKNTVNNSGTDSTAKEAVVIQEGVVGSAADKRILVRFFSSTGVDPTAA